MGTDYEPMHQVREHHLFAAVPCYHLRKLSKTITSDLPNPRTVFGAWRDMRQIWKRQQVDPTYQFDTPLPDKKKLSDKQDALDSSLGDLTPDSLK